ncbi:MAG: exodeoxyribonuclease VII large subunit [Phycisphaerales bacterium JB065]
MERLPFDPSKARGARQSSAPKTDDARPLSVSQLSASIDAALKDGLPTRLSVRGEISGLKTQTHWYFTLKDEHSVIGGVMFASSARRQSFTPSNGDEVIVTGRVEYWAKGGRIQIYADRMEPVGQGKLEREYQALLAELRAAGWFDPARKRPLPPFPRKVAVVTSATGAALQDVIDTARRRCPSVELCVVDVRVQGESAAPQITRAITWLSSEHESLGIDAIILTRGGGSLEDLWAFNERRVAQAVFECGVPIVAAIGHETDTTIAELIADERCATPTQAAMRLLPDAEAMREQVQQFGRRLDARTLRLLSEERRHLDALLRLPALRDSKRTIQTQRDRLERLEHTIRHVAHRTLADQRRRLARAATSLEQHRPSVALANRWRRLDHASFTLDASIRMRVRRTDHFDRFDDVHNALARRLERSGDRLSALGRELEIISPLRILSRGYTVTTDDSGRILRTAEEARAASVLQTRFTDGTVRSMPTDSQTPSPPPRVSDAPAPLAPRLSPRAIGIRKRGGTKPRSVVDPDQLGLFHPDEP